MFNGEATHINYLVFDLTRPWLEPTTYRHRGEYTNHYTAATVGKYMIISIINNDVKSITYKLAEKNRKLQTNISDCHVILLYIFL